MNAVAIVEMLMSLRVMSLLRMYGSRSGSGGGNG